MKKNIKRILVSSLSAVLFGSMAVGATYALFTSKADSSIDIESGIVKVEQEMSIVSVSELGDVEVSAEEGVYTNSIGGKTYVDSSNAGVLHLEKWAPGDKAVLKVTSRNESNVDIKTRFSVSHSSTSNPDLFEALEIGYEFESGYSSAITASNYKEWTGLEVPQTDNHKIMSLTITVNFPDGDDGEILFGDANHDNIYQDLNCAIAFSQEAVQGNAYAPSTLDLINAILDESAGKNPTMYDALAEVNLTASETAQNHYVWDSVNDKFLYEESVTPGYAYFKAYKSMPADPSFSVYAYDWNGASSLALDGIGFDAGDESGFESISYINSSANEQSVIIRTNGGTLTVNAPTDEVAHYGSVDYVDIIAVKSSSYEEHGKVSLIKLANGNVEVLESSNIGRIHLAATTGAFNDIKITVDDGAALPELTRDSVGTNLAETILVCEVSENGDSEFYWLSGNGTLEDEKVLVSESLEAEKVAADDNDVVAVAIANEKNGGSEVIDKGVSVETAEEIEEAIEDGESRTTAKDFALIEDVEQLRAFRDAYNSGKIAEGFSFKLMADVDISGEPWEPIGNGLHPFNGTFDGNNKTITGLSNEGYSIDENGIFTTDHSLATGAPYGLFGTVGSKTNNKASVNVSNLSLADVDIEDDMFSCVGALIGGDVGAIKYNNAYINSNYAGDIIVHNVNVAGTKVYGVDGVGGLIGKIYTKGHVEATGCDSSIDVYAIVSTNKKAAALVGYASGGASYNISGNTISGDVYSRNTSDYLLDQVANIKKVKLNYIFGVGDNECSNKLFLIEDNEPVEYKMPYVISHEKDGNGDVIHSIITYVNEAEPGVNYLKDNRQDLCDGTIIRNMDDSIYGHFFQSYNTLEGSIQFVDCLIGTNMKEIVFKNTTNVLFKDCDIIAGSGDGIYMVVFGGTLTLDLGEHTSHRTVQICKGGTPATNQACPEGTTIRILSGTYTNSIYNHGATNGVIEIEGGLFTFEESQYGLNKGSGRGNDAFNITGGSFAYVCGLDPTRSISIDQYVPSPYSVVYGEVYMSVEVA